MIDAAWLMQVSALADAPLSGEETARLAQELGEEREVLPHFLLYRGLFADWPKARAAVREASRAVIRPRAIPTDAFRSVDERKFAACKQDILRQIRAIPDKPEAGAQVKRKGKKKIKLSPESEKPKPVELAPHRRKLSRAPQPNDFIGNDG
ncbi:MAG: hypothetical protein ACXIUO_03085 [Erythrobacter sp.]